MKNDKKNLEKMKNKYEYFALFPYFSYRNFCQFEGEKTDIIKREILFS